MWPCWGCFNLIVPNRAQPKPVLRINGDAGVLSHRPWCTTWLYGSASIRMSSWSGTPKFGSARQSPDRSCHLLSIGTGKAGSLSSPSTEQQPLLSIKGHKSFLCVIISDSRLLITLQRATTNHALHCQYQWPGRSDDDVEVTDAVPNASWQMTLMKHSKARPLLWSFNHQMSQL